MSDRKISNPFFVTVGVAAAAITANDLRCTSVLFENDDDAAVNGNTAKIVLGDTAGITTALPGIRVGNGVSFSAPRGDLINLKDVFAIAGAAAQTLKVTILR